MRVLAIETSERVGTLAALQAIHQLPWVVGAVALPGDQRSARTLLPAIKTLLVDCGWKPNQLDLICVTSGPGSFTGLRIGVTTAKTLAYATGAQLVEVHTLSAMAAGVPARFPVGVARSWQRLWTILDAQRQELYVASFEPGTPLDDAPQTRILGVAEWLQELRTGDLVSGPPLKKLAERLPAKVLMADAADWLPRAEAVGRLGVAACRRGISVDPMQLVPRYYRKSAAEEKAQRHP